MPHSRADSTPPRSRSAQTRDEQQLLDALSALLDAIERNTRRINRVEEVFALHSLDRGGTALAKPARCSRGVISAPRNAA